MNIALYHLVYFHYWHFSISLSFVYFIVDQTSEAGLAQVFSGNRLLPGSDPVAHCYCGHQFGVFAGQLGVGSRIPKPLWCSTVLLMPLMRFLGWGCDFAWRSQISWRQIGDRSNSVTVECSAERKWIDSVFEKRGWKESAAVIHARGKGLEFS